MLVIITQKRNLSLSFTSSSSILTLLVLVFASKLSHFMTLFLFPKMMIQCVSVMKINELLARLSLSRSLIYSLSLPHLFSLLTKLLPFMGTLWCHQSSRVNNELTHNPTVTFVWILTNKFIFLSPSILTPSCIVYLAFIFSEYTPCSSCSCYYFNYTRRNKRKNVYQFSVPTFLLWHEGVISRSETCFQPFFFLFSFPQDFRVWSLYFMLFFPFILLSLPFQLLCLSDDLRRWTSRNV